MNTVWIINHYAQAPGGPGGIRHYQFAKALKKRGWNVSIIAASTEHVTGCQRLNPGETARLDVVDEIPFLWLRTPQYRSNGLARIINMFTFSYRLLGHLPRKSLASPDIIIGSSVHPFAVWSAERLSMHFKVPFVFEVRDLWPQTLIDFGLIGGDSLVAKLLRLLEGYLYRKASAIITLLPLAHRYIQKFGVNRELIHWIPNGVDLECWPIREIHRKSNSPLKLMYFGAFGQANALDVLLRAIHELRSRPACPSFTLRLIGEGPLKDDLIQMALRLGVADISFEDAVPKSDIPLLASQADVLLASMKDCSLYQYGISLNKLFDYMAAARPVIFACAAANNPVATAAAGFTVPPNSPVALADAISEMALLPSRDLRRMGLAGRAYVEREHNSDLLGQRLSEILESCIKGSRFT